MTKIKISEATLTQLNYLVAKCEGLNPRFFTENEAYYAELKQKLKRGEYVVVLRPNGKLTPLAKYNSYNDGVCLKDVFSPSTDWSQGGPIIAREMSAKCGRLCIKDETYATETTQRFSAEYTGRNWEQHRKMYGPTPLIAAMRCYVASKLGDEVEVPEELA